MFRIILKLSESGVILTINMTVYSILAFMKLENYRKLKPGESVRHRQCTQMSHCFIPILIRIAVEYAPARYVPQ
jgi:hypothetical protein